MLKKLLTKSLLIAAGLCVGSSAWASTTITYDFQAYTKAKCPKFRNDVKLTLSSNYVTNEQSTNIYVVNDLDDFSFGGNFAFQTTDFCFRNGSSSNEDSGKGLTTAGNDRYFSIMNVAVGDKVTITCSDDAIEFVSTNVTYDVSGTPTTPAKWAKLTSGTEYTVTTAGRLDLNFKGKNNTGRCIHKVVIVTNETETMTAPTFAMTGVNGTSRIISLYHGVSSLNSNATSYYTTDGSTPTTASTEYTGPFEIATTSTIKAITVSKSTAATISAVGTSDEFEAGTAVALNAATCTHTGSGKYTITNDQSDLLFTPTATVHYAIGGGEEQTSTSTSFVVDIPEDGTLSYWLTADGYTSTAVTNVDAFAGITMIQDNLLDFCTSNINTWAVKGDEVNVGGSTYYQYKDQNSNVIGDGILAVSWNNADTDGNAYRIYRYYGGVGHHYKTGTFVLLNLKRGQIVKVECAGYSEVTNLTLLPAETYGDYRAFRVNADGNATISFGKGVSVKKIYINTEFVPATINPNYGMATFSSTYALDFTNVTALTAYQATACDGTNVTLEPVTGVVAAGTGLLIKGVTDDIPVSSETGTSYSATDCHFFACDGSFSTVPKASSGTNFVLSVQGGNVVFAYIDGVPAPIKAGQAALWANISISDIIPADAKLRLVFGDDDATAIKGIESEKNAENGAIYNLAGQRVNAGYKGIVIKNGKKFMNK